MERLNMDLSVASTRFFMTCSVPPICMSKVTCNKLIFMSLFSLGVEACVRAEIMDGFIYYHVTPRKCRLIIVHETYLNSVLVEILTKSGA